MKLFAIDSSVRLVLRASDKVHAQRIAEIIANVILSVGKQYQECENIIVKLDYGSVEEINPAHNKIMTRALAPGWYIAPNGTRAQVIMVPRCKDAYGDTTVTDKMVRLFPVSGKFYEITPEQCDEYNLILNCHD